MNPLLAAAFLVLTGLASAQGSLFGTYYRTVIVNTKASGAGVSADVANFPLAVSFDSSTAPEMFSQAAPGGADLRVTDASGTNPVAFELEHWDAARKRASLWLLAPLVKGNDSAVAFRIYWGREGAASVSSPQGVFDTANGFQAVFHFGEGTNDTGYDATANAFRAAPYDAPADTLGMVGRARRLNGTSQRFLIPGSASGRLSFELADSYTLSAWVAPDSVTLVNNNGHAFISKSDNQYLFNIYGADTKYWHSVIRGNNKFMECASNGIPEIPAASSVGTWHQLTLSLKGAPVGGELEASLYFDGALVNRCLNPNESNNGRNTTKDVSLGAHIGGASTTSFNRYWKGFLDEIRLENRARDSAWIKLSYFTQRSGGNAVTLGTAVNTAIAGARPGNSARLSVRAASGGLEFTLGEAPGAARALWTLTDARGRVVWSRESDLTASRVARWEGGKAATGVYLLRVSLVDAAGHPIGAVTRVIPVAR